MPPTARLVLMSIAFSALVTGCADTSRDPVSPSARVSSGRDTDILGATVDPATAAWAVLGFYPLEPGNRWQYQRRFEAHMLDESGQSLWDFAYRSVVERVQTCVQSRESGTYQIERVVETSSDDRFVSWAWLRQDMDGLYQADLLAREAPDCEEGSFSATSPRLDDPALGADPFEHAAARLGEPAVRAAFERAWSGLRARLEVERQLGAGLCDLAARSRGPTAPPAGEMQRLRYPLFPGQRWRVRTEPRLDARVQGIELLRLPVGWALGWRIRYTWATAPDDRILVWYGPRGFLRLTQHSVYPARDGDGNPVGTIVATEDQWLDGIQLVHAPRRLAGEATTAGE